MIDLSYKPKKDPNEWEPGNEPAGVVILGIMPFVLLFCVLAEVVL